MMDNKNYLISTSPPSSSSSSSLSSSSSSSSSLSVKTKAKVPTPSTSLKMKTDNLKVKINAKLIKTPSPVSSENGNSSSNEIENLKNASVTQKIETFEMTEMEWDSPPKSIFIIKQIHNDVLNSQLLTVSKYLVKKYKCDVYCEELTYNEIKENYKNDDKMINISSFLIPVKKKESKILQIFDLVICLGGDGTVLHTIRQFNLISCPPILAFNCGSMGFLAIFDIKDIIKTIDKIFKELKVSLSVRMRLKAEIERKDGTIDKKKYTVINEVVVDRGSSPFLTKLHCLINGNFITSIQADGIILATTTGSTAYSLSAGGSMVHPNVQCMLLTPICPHTLNFRPIILPDNCKLAIKVPIDGRSTAWCSFDGKERQELQKGDSVIISTCNYPALLVSKTDQTSEWFQTLKKTLCWNIRQQQKALSNKQLEEISNF